MAKKATPSKKQEGSKQGTDKPIPKKAWDKFDKLMKKAVDKGKEKN